MLSDDESNFLLIQSCISIVYHHPEWGGLLLSDLMCHVKQTSGPPSEKKFERGKPSGSLRCLLECQEDVEKHEVPILAILFSHPLKHSLQHLVKVFNEPIGLGMIY